MAELDYKEIVNRMVEESGAKNPRDLDRLIGTPESYAYAMMERGVSKGYLEKFIEAVPDADLNYIFTGRRSTTPGNPREAVTHLILQLTGNKEFTEKMARKYDEAVDEASEDLTRDQYHEEVLRLVLRLLSIALEE